MRLYRVRYTIRPVLAEGPDEEARSRWSAIVAAPNAGEAQALVRAHLVADGGPEDGSDILDLSANEIAAGEVHVFLEEGFR